jgi:hypothetical protein
MIDGLQPGQHLALVREAAIEQASHPGREFELQGETGTVMLGRAFVVGDRLYLVWVMGESAQVRSDAAKSFLDSFSIVEVPKRDATAG